MCVDKPKHLFRKYKTLLLIFVCSFFGLSFRFSTVPCNFITKFYYSWTLQRVAVLKQILLWLEKMYPESTVQYTWIYGTCPNITSILFCKVVSYIGSKTQRKMEFVLKKKNKSNTGFYTPKIEDWFFLCTLDTNINCMDWELLIFNIIQQSTQVELYKYIPYNNHMQNHFITNTTKTLWKT